MPKIISNKEYKVLDDIRIKLISQNAPYDSNGDMIRRRYDIVKRTPAEALGCAYEY